MRCFGKPKAEVSRTKRRARLATLIAWGALPLAASAVHADQPVVPVAGIAENPFCAPVKVATGNIRLASSGNTESAVRLVPVGRAVGLHRITGPNATKPSTPAVTVDPVAPAPVRGNPMAYVKRGPVLRLEPVKVIGRGEPAPAVAPSAMIPAVEIPAVDANAWGTVVRQTANENPASPNATPSNILSAPQASVRASAPLVLDDSRATANADVEIQMNRTAPGELSQRPSEPAEQPGSVLESEPIVFSLSDDSEAVSANLLEPEEDDQEVVITPVEDSPAAINLSFSDTGESPALPPLPEIEPESIIADVVAPLNLPALNTASNEVVPMDPLAELDDESANEILRRNRYRPPVDVTAVPMAIERLMDADDESSTVAAVEDVVADILQSMDLPDTIDADGNVALGGDEPQPESLSALPQSEMMRPEMMRPEPIADTSMAPLSDLPELGDLPELEPLPQVAGTNATDSVLQPERLPPVPKLELPEGMTAIPLHLNFAQVRSLTVGGSLKDIRILDHNICQAVATGSNQIKLIGTGNGVTQLVVWAEVDDEKNPSRMQAFEIHVDSHQNAAVADDSLGMLSQSIRQTFPMSEVTLDGLGDRVRVSGRCTSEADAKKIVRMVRRTCLIPVEDQLEVR